MGKTKNKGLATVEGILRDMSVEDSCNWLNQVYIQHSLSKIYADQGRLKSHMNAKYASMHAAISYIKQVFEDMKGNPNKINYIYIKAVAQIGILHSKDLGEPDKTDMFSKTISHTQKMIGAIEEEEAGGISLG